MVSTYLRKGLEESPLAFLHIAHAVPTSAYDVAVDPERFSFRESLAHISDWELINLERLQAGLNEPGCTVMGLDAGERGEQMGYANTNPIEEIQKFVERRRTLLEIVDRMGPDDTSIVFYHSERGEMTVLDYLTSILGHDMHHLEHAARYLRSA